MAKGNDPVKKFVNYTLYEDGMKPGLAPWGAAIRLPIDLSIGPGERVMVRLNVSFDVAAQVYPTLSLSNIDTLVWESLGTAGRGPGALLSPETPVVLALRNNSKDYLRFEAKEVIANVVFLYAPDDLRKSS